MSSSAIVPDASFMNLARMMNNVGYVLGPVQKGHWIDCHFVMYPATSWVSRTVTSVESAWILAVEHYVSQHEAKDAKARERV